MPDEPTESSLAIFIAQRAQIMQNFIKGYQSKERYIEIWPQRQKTLNEAIARARAKFDAAKRELDAELEKFKDEEAHVTTCAKFIEEHKVKYEEFEMMKEKISVDLAEKLKKLSAEIE